MSKIWWISYQYSSSLKSAFDIDNQCIGYYKQILAKKTMVYHSVKSNWQRIFCRLANKIGNEISPISTRIVLLPPTAVFCTPQLYRLTHQAEVIIIYCHNVIQNLVP